MTHPAWKPRGPEWATLAPGVAFLLRPVTGELQAKVNARVARAVASLGEGRAVLEDLGFDPEDMGQLGDLNVLAGLGLLLAAVYYGEELIEAWRGVSDADSGEAVEVSPEAIRAVLRLGTPEAGAPLLEPFMAWIDRPRIPIAADQRRLRELAKWEHGGGATHCQGCDQFGAECARGGTDGGDRCPRAVNAPQTEPGQLAWTAAAKPGAWQRAGMGGRITGLNYGACLRTAVAEAGTRHAWLDEAALVRCLAAIEAGTLEAMVEKAGHEGAGRQPT